jgi:hypothetical protein
MSCIERLMPEFDVESRHAVRISARGESVYRCARELDLSRSLLIRTLFRLRGLPSAALRLDGLEQMGFRALEESPPREFALGLIGQFWRPAGGLVDFEPAAFTGFDRPGYAKVAWSFDVREDPYGATFVETVTRVHCTDDGARRRFRRYWRLVGPFSGLIREHMLRLLRTEAESSR